MKIASALEMDSNMSPLTWDTPSYVGAEASTYGRSKLMALCGPRILLHVRSHSTTRLYFYLFVKNWVLEKDLELSLIFVLFF